MSWSFFPESKKQLFNLPHEQKQNSHEAFNKLHELLNSIGSTTIIRGRFKKSLINSDSSGAICLYTRSGNPIRRFFQRVLDWTNGAKNSRVIAKNIISKTIDGLNLKENESAKNIIKNINEIINSEKDFNTEQLQLNVNKLKNLLDKNSDSIQKDPEIMQIISQFTPLLTEENFTELLIIKDGESVTSPKISDSKKEISVIKTKEQSKNTDSPQGKSNISDEKFILEKPQEDEEIFPVKTVQSLTNNPPIASLVKPPENIAKSAVSLAEKRFGGLLVINKTEPVVMNRPLHTIFADAYIFPTNTTEPQFDGSGLIEKKPELKNNRIGKFEQLINYETRPFLKIQLDSPRKTTDDPVIILSAEDKANYRDELKKLYLENFRLVVKEFPEGKEQRESSIALVPISQGIFTQTEAQALGAAVQEFKKEYPHVLIQVLADGKTKKRMIETALSEALAAAPV